MQHYRCVYVVNYTTKENDEIQQKRFSSSLKAFDFIYPEWELGNLTFNSKINEYKGMTIETVAA